MASKQSYNVVGQVKDVLTDVMLANLKDVIISSIKNNENGVNVSKTDVQLTKLGAGAMSFNVVVDGQDSGTVGKINITGTAAMDKDGVWRINGMHRATGVSKTSGSKSSYSESVKDTSYKMSKYVNAAKKKKNFDAAQSKAAKAGHSVYHSDNSGGHYYGVVYDR